MFKHYRNDESVFNCDGADQRFIDIQSASLSESFLAQAHTLLDNKNIDQAAHITFFQAIDTLLSDDEPDDVLLISQDLGPVGRIYLS
jgi:hypothetical protein